MKNKESGSALLVSLVLLVVVILLSFSSYQNAHMEEQMAGNQRFSVGAFQAAEAGINDIVDQLRNNFTPDAPLECETNPTFAAPQEIDFSAGVGLTGSYEFWLVCENDIPIGYSVGRIDFGEGEEPVVRTIKLRLDPPGFGLNSDLYYGIKAEGNINLSGQNVIRGNVHTNSDLTINQIDVEGLGNISSTGNITTRDKDLTVVTTEDGSGECGSVACAVAGVKPKTIEPADAEITRLYNDHWEQDNFIDMMVDYGTCDITLEGDREGEIYYCSEATATMTVSGSFNNVTLLSRGNLEHNGASELGDSNADGVLDGEDAIDTNVVVSGDITLNGNDDSYMVLWSGGHITQNGDSTLYGSIISGGEVTRNGGIDFSSWDNYVGETFSKVKKFGNIISWLELEQSF